MKNLPPFYIGQTVEYITGKNMPKGTRGKVLDIQKDCCCAGWMIKFSVKDSIPRSAGRGGLIKCDNCGVISTVIQWTKLPGYWEANSFKAVQELPFPSLTYKRVVEKESELISLN